MMRYQLEFIHPIQNQSRYLVVNVRRASSRPNRLEPIPSSLKYDVQVAALVIGYHAILADQVLQPFHHSASCDVDLSDTHAE